MLPEVDQKKKLQILREAAHAKMLVPFVGAGVSMAARVKSGNKSVYPSWNELLLAGAERLSNREQKDFVEAGVRSRFDPLQLAQTIRDHLTTVEWNSFLLHYLNPSVDTIEKDSLSVARAVWDISANFVITTNYDKVLRWAVEDNNVEQIDFSDYALLGNATDTFDKPTVFHLHGYVPKLESLILTDKAYKHFYSEADPGSPYRAAQMTLNALLYTKTMLFIGFSFSDPFVSRTLERLASAFRNSSRVHYALVKETMPENDQKKLYELNIMPIFFREYEDLADILRGIIPLELKESRGNLLNIISPVPDPKPITPALRWRSARGYRLLDRLGPAYILDQTYHFQDWNPAFDRLFARPLQLYRGQSVQEFLQGLVNTADIEARATMVFRPAAFPMVDIETLFFRSDEFGVMELKKIAARIINEDGEPVAWSVMLNIIKVEKERLLWDELHEALEHQINWSLYASHYDRILLNFREYGKLVNEICGMLGNVTKCADLGAGTGNGSLELLKLKANRTVYAIEPNEEMLEQLSKKIERSDPDIKDRIKIIKQDLDGLGEFGDSYIDGAIMINVLYAIDDPATVLAQIARIIRPGGILALSTTHTNTDIDHLFSCITTDLADQNKLLDLQDSVEKIRERHATMDEIIHRYSLDQTRSFLEQAGFAVESWEEGKYCGAVVVIKATRI